MNEIQFFGALELGLIFGFIAWGIYLSLRILQFPDMTVDGGFPLGAGIAAMLIMKGLNPWLATGCACFCGALSGLITGWLTMRWKILHLLSGILTMTALMSINLRIMQGPNIALLQEHVIFTPFIEWIDEPQQAILFALILLVVLFSIIFYHFLISQQGLAMRAVGANSRMAQSLGIMHQKTVLIGLALSNSFIAFVGALFAQAQGFADVSMGSGMLVEGLAAVIIGEAFLPSRKLSLSLVRCLLGSIFYRLIIAFALNLDTLGLQASDLKLVTAIIVGVAMIFPQLRAHLSNKLRK